MGGALAEVLLKQFIYFGVKEIIMRSFKFKLVNALYLYSAFLVFQHRQAFTNSHTYLHTDSDVASLQSANLFIRNLFTHTHTHTTGAVIRINRGFKETLTCRSEEPGIKTTEPLIGRRPILSTD